MKKTVLVGILCCLLLSGCANGQGSGGQPSDGPDTQEETTASDQQGGQPSQDTTRQEYYEGLIADLQKEVLDLKSQLYITQTEYEAELEALREQLKGDSDGGSQDTVAKDQPFTYVLENGKAIITGYTGDEVRIEIPSEIDGYSVVAIGDRAFENHLRLRSAHLPDSVCAIGWFSFSGCIALEAVSVPASVESIGYGAFQNCNSGLTVYCIDGSYAQQYARSYGIRTGA